LAHLGASINTCNIYITHFLVVKTAAGDKVAPLNIVRLHTPRAAVVRRPT
jgi:hypothetical protein